MTDYTCSVLLACLLAAGATAQAPFDVGWRDASFANPTGSGSSPLLARVFYPAAAAGNGTPVLQTASSWPVVVFLHGFGGIGSFYVDLASAWAERGHVAVMWKVLIRDWFFPRESDVRGTPRAAPRHR